MQSQFLERALHQIEEAYHIDPELYAKFDVKRGLRNADGSGVLAGLTKISSVVGFKKTEAGIEPVDGRLYYRGININEIVEGIQKERRHGFAEVAYLLLLGRLPNKQELEEFDQYLRSRRTLDEEVLTSQILHLPSNNVMNQLQRTVLALYVLDKNADDVSIANVLRQSLEIVAKFPTIIAYALHARNHWFHGQSLFIHLPDPELDLAENFLYMLRPDGKFTPLEAEILDLALILHAEHGGGNNSTFTMHVVTSSWTDTYAAVAAAISSLKGPLHGAANANVMDMMQNIKENVKDWNDQEEVASYIEKILRKEAHNRTGLVYGMGHAVYTKSDPRALILREKARELAAEKGRLDEFNLYRAVETLTPEIFRRVKKSNKVISANVDFYSGFVYDMLGFPKEIYTPLFAMARIVGWSAHRMEELISGGRIIRPSYKSVAEVRHYVPLDQRG
ncbi:MAG: citrate/2-methylcitrate synthase [Calditrichaeota bacterium]|nr:MAG: citrate/2-methylcitrate synthase [Calditrichota bacterium]